MKTKFLLHGGQLRYDDERNNSYFKELTIGLVDGDMVLFIGFARTDKSDRQRVFERDGYYIRGQSKEKLVVVDATHKDFLSQLKESKAIHITGGETEELIKAMQQHPEFRELIKGKTVGGTSAGACLLATCYIADNAKGVKKGLGLLPVAIKVHADGLEYGDPDTTSKLLEECPSNVERITLNECAWIS